MTSTQMPSPTASHQRLYDADFLEWVNHTAELLKQGRFDELDIENLIEEVETLGRSEQTALRSNFRVLLMHLLKWRYQPSKRSSSWSGTIVEHRIRIQDDFGDSPSLRNHYTQVFDKTYEQARTWAATETGLDLSTFSDECPYTTEQVLDDQFWPE